MGVVVPESMTTDTEPLELADPAEADIVQEYLDERERLFPGISLTEKAYFGLPKSKRQGYMDSHPELKTYWSWKNEQYLKSPVLMEYLMSEENELFDAPPEIRQAVLEYRVTKERMFPNIYELQERFYAIPEGPTQGQNRYNFLHMFPELKRYWEWNAAIKEQFPEIVPYITERDFQDISDAALSAKQDPAPIDMRDFPEGLIRQLAGHYLYGEQLTNGAKQRLYRIWEKAGRPQGKLDAWINGELKYMFQ